MHQGLRGLLLRVASFILMVRTGNRQADMSIRSSVYDHPLITTPTLQEAAVPEGIAALVILGEISKTIAYPMEL